ncbi:hypothetical protein J2128_002347 [Methanomicrobium sp. W14]|uniref:hypothetical protein n=1 Tax=Methanomicrobium sp. W14 TaxID=2817839 RepID=UPI001AE5F7B7|nr:hypothetical protein [Methanomicrobium sp. W14]MBP2134381.1 hypothetical protein [Methanomicrobium sp. W14]
MRFFGLLLTGFFLVSALIAGASAQEIQQGVSYTINPVNTTGEDDGYKIDFEIYNISAGGLSVEFPGTFEMKDTNIPDGHYGSDGKTLIISLTGETEIWVDVVCKDLKSGEILATWDDLENGTHGGDEMTVKESEKEEKEEAEGKGSRSPSKQATPGFLWVTSAMSVLAAGACLGALKEEGEA